MYCSIIHRELFMRYIFFAILYTIHTAAFGQTAPHIIIEIPSIGKVIDEPGTYIFVNDIVWNPHSDTTCIKIQANHVILDMQGHTLQCTSSTYKTVGILATGCENIHILNGSVINMGLAGVKFNQCINASLQKVVVDGLNVQDIVNYTVPTGILANECIHVMIDKCVVKNINVKTGSSAAIQLTQTIASKVTRCSIKNLLNLDGACTGIGHLSCDDALVKSCTIDNMKSEFVNNLNTEGHTCIGIVPVDTTNLKIEDCTISNIVGCCDDAHGMSIFICANAIIKKCKVLGVIDGLGKEQKGAKATGIEVYASDVLVSDCYVRDITAINPEDKQATGFSCALCTGVEFHKCKAENVQVYDQDGNQSSDLGYGTGFGWAPDPRPEFIFPAANILYRCCVAKHCQVGFDSWFHIDCEWDHIVSKNNQIPILNENQPPRTLTCNPCSECGCQQAGCYPRPHEVTLENIADNNRFLHFKIK